MIPQQALSIKQQIYKYYELYNYDDNLLDYVKK